LRGERSRCICHGQRGRFLRRQERCCEPANSFRRRSSGEQGSEGSRTPRTSAKPSAEARRTGTDRSAEARSGPAQRFIGREVEEPCRDRRLARPVICAQSLRAARCFRVAGHFASAFGVRASWEVTRSTPDTARYWDRVGARPVAHPRRQVKAVHPLISSDRRVVGLSK